MDQKESDFSISDSGPNHELHIYDRKSGTIVWRVDAKGDKVIHAKYLEEAERMLDTANKVGGYQWQPPK